MKKSIIIIVLFILFVPNYVKADKGELRYEITDVDIYESTITFKGWAYIHKTNNYVTVVDKKGNVIKTDGGQKITIWALKDGNIIDSVTVSGSDKINYNFYCELYFKGGQYQCTENRYLDLNHNTCNGKDVVTSQCYYEDMYFEISFDTSEWDVYSDEQIIFKIAAYNNDYGQYSNSEVLSISRAAVSNFSTDYVLIDEDNVESSVSFMASYGLLRNYSLTDNFRYNGVCTHGVWSSKGNNKYDLYFGDSYKYPNGRSKTGNNLRCYDFLGSDCVGTHMYAIKVKKSNGSFNGSCYFAEPSYSNSDFSVAIAYGSHIKPIGEFSIKVKNDKKCEPKEPSNGDLMCNDSKTFNSECEELTVKTDVGSSVVTISQVGNVSSVLTPDSIFDGGGFNFGILYTNTIKWDYAKEVPNDTLHNAIVKEMNNKIKNYDSFVAGLVIKELKFDDKIRDTSFLYKKCYTSDSNNDYYKKELTVTCLFHIPKSEKRGSNVDYFNGIEGLGISNKYYTPIAYNGKYKIEAKIVGMDRIKSNTSKDDMDEKKTPSGWEGGWTGIWEDDFVNCELDVYNFITYELPDPGKKTEIAYRYIYRPIDIYNPFPNRNAGINWYDWIAITKNRERLENSYDSLEYIANINNHTIATIKQYNKNHNYLDWDLTWDSVDEKYYSEFINEYGNIIQREGDN